MDNEHEESQVLLSFEEIPSALLKLTERSEILKIVVCLFKGWDEGVAELKSHSIASLSNCNKGLNVIKSDLLSLQLQLEAFTAKGNELKSLKHKLQFVLNNIPDRFNCPSNIAVPNDPNTLIANTKPGVVKSSALGTTMQPVSNSPTVPEVFFLTTDEFEKVPKYLKGRVTYEKINAFVELLNKVLSFKYSIFKKKKSTLKKTDADLWNEYYKQELKETKGLYFCVANDFKNLNGSVLDKASLNMLTILRHCGRIRELRSGGLLRYVTVF